MLKVTKKSMNDVCNNFHVKNLEKEPTFLKNPNNLSCICPFLTNCSKRFQDTQKQETGLSGFHK